MSRLLVDTNVLLDLVTNDTTWRAWSRAQVRTAAVRGRLLIYAELASAFTTAKALYDWLDPAVFDRAALPYAAGWHAAQAFVQYRQAGGVRNAPLPDFYIWCPRTGRRADAHHPRHGPVSDDFSGRDVDHALTVENRLAGGKVWVQALPLGRNG